MLPEKGLDFRIVPTSVVVWSDPQLLARILRNLVANALQYTERGRVLVGARYGIDNVRLQVLDTGPGISAEDRERVFAAYERADHNGQPGIGLGLNVVQKIVDLLGYDLALQSSSRGTCFSLSLPVSSYAEARVTLPSPDIAWLNGLRVVAVDDDPDIRSALRELFGGVGVCSYGVRWQVGGGALDRYATCPTGNIAGGLASG